MYMYRFYGGGIDTQDQRRSENLIKFTRCFGRGRILQKSMSGPKISNGDKDRWFFKWYNLILNKLPLMANARSPAEIATLYEK